MKFICALAVIWGLTPALTLLGSDPDNTPATIQLGSDPSRTPGTDARWQPWLGCWQLAGKGDGPQVCVTPSPQSPGVTLKTRADGKVVLEQTIIADGAQQPLTEASCHGWQR